MKAQEKPMSSLTFAFFYGKWTRRQSPHDATSSRMLWALETDIDIGRKKDIRKNAGSHA